MSAVNIVHTCGQSGGEFFSGAGVRNWLAKESSQSDKIGHPSHDLLKYLISNRLNYSLMPEIYSGLGYGFLDEFDLIFSASRISGTLGWIVFQLCGNPGRVLSFFNDDFVRYVVRGAGENLIVSYHTDPRFAEVEKTSVGFRVSGSWAYGSLSQVASHFAIPFLHPETRRRHCHLVPREEVEVVSDWKSRSLSGTSTTTYRVKDLFVPFSLAPLTECNNSLFSPHFSIARAPIKHLAWTLGVLDGLLVELGAQLGVAANHLFEQFQPNAQKLKKRVKEKLAKLQMRVELGQDVSLYAQKIELLSRKVHSWVMEVAIAIHVACPIAVLDEDSRLSGFIREILACSTHEAVRETARAAAWCSDDSPRMKSCESILNEI